MEQPGAIEILDYRSRTGHFRARINGVRTGAVVVPAAEVTGWFDTATGRAVVPYGQPAAKRFDMRALSAVLAAAHADEVE